MTPAASTPAARAAADRIQSGVTPVKSADPIRTGAPSICKRNSRRLAHITMGLSRSSQDRAAGVVRAAAPLHSWLDQQAGPDPYLTSRPRRATGKRAELPFVRVQGQVQPGLTAGCRARPATAWAAPSRAALLRNSSGRAQWSRASRPSSHPAGRRMGRWARSCCQPWAAAFSPSPPPVRRARRGLRTPGSSNESPWRSAPGRPARR